MIKYKIVNIIPSDLYVPLLNLIHESFDEHKKNGLNFTCSNYTMDDLKNKVLNGYCFLALDVNSNILGITSVSFFNSSQYAYENITCVSPLTKGMGVGTALLNKRTEFLKSLGCKYMLSDTAVSAKDSVNWHLKKCKCRIVGYRSFENTNYYSFVFREDFEPVTLRQRLKDKYTLIKNFIYFHIFFNSDGTLTKLGKIKTKWK